MLLLSKAALLTCAMLMHTQVYALALSFCISAHQKAMHVNLIYRMNSLLVHIRLALLCCIMRFAFTLLPCSLL